MTAQERTDEELLAAVAAGPGSLAELYRRHVAKIVGFGARRFDEPEDVADLVAAVFLEVMESAGSFDPRRGTAVAWLYGVAANLAAEERRRRTRGTGAVLKLTGRRFLEADDYVRIEERIDAAAEMRAVYAAVGQLAPADRRLLELVAVDELSPVEAADALGISRVAARVRLSRARRRLREVMARDTAEAIEELSKEVIA